MENAKARIDDLRQALAGGKLEPRDLSFALSLVAQWERRQYLSERQWPYVASLTAKALGQAPERRETPIGDLSAVMALFDRAGARLKRPSIVMGDGTGAEYRLKVAKPGTRVPGAIDVTGRDGGAWYGRILQDGRFQASPRVATPEPLPAALVAFASAPAAFAGRHAKATGRCMFCNLAIGEGEDPRAIAVGYGETCAGNWALPFPAKAAARAANAALFTSGSVSP